ncbi:MAG TPA: cyclopropane-fatty-acyl-phospholipid synthase family protein [Rhizomicrobium sp.]|jgi:cyclopropane-fatty-acyl-phospholipid synthase|nr:cyclopropane-fatty-acyl-phospholipid synthase family protein [Rhizomicrobium sp.]
MNFISNSAIQKRWLDAIARLEFGTLEFVAPDGTETIVQGPQPGPRGRFIIHEWDVLRRTIARGDIGLGEDFIAGAWETDDIESLISVFLLNLDYLADFAHGNFLNRLLFVAHNAFVRRNSMSGSRKNIEAHYDVGNDFYRLWLDETMTYSSALFHKPDNTLAEAQRNKYGRILEHFNSPRASVLEIGCGWGGFAEEASRASHDVTGLTISPSQHKFASARLNGNADIRLEDYRKVRGTFDVIVSIEMFEAVGEHYWPQYFRAIAQRLRRGGSAMIQTIAIRDEVFADYRTRSDFIRHYVFPGGMLPSLQRFREEAERAGLKIRDTFSFGQDYARTLREWAARMRVKESEVMALGHDGAFLRNWQFYLGICAASFAVERSNVIQIELAHA